MEIFYFNSSYYLQLFIYIMFDSYISYFSVKFLFKFQLLSE